MSSGGKRITDYDRVIANNVREMRLKKQLSQEEVAKGLELTFQQIQKYERGVNRISAGNLARLAGLFGVRVSELYRGVDYGAVGTGTMGQLEQDKGSVIIPYGRSHVQRFTEDQMRNALNMAFKDRPEAGIVLDSNPRFREFEAACAAWAIDKGYAEVTRVDQGDQEQVTLVEFTQKGKDELLGRRCETTAG